MRFIVTIGASLALLAFATTGQCQTIINTDTTINTDRTDDITIQNGINPAHQTTVNVVDPADVHGSIFAQDSSVLNVLGGTVQNAFNSGNATINVLGGHVVSVGDVELGGGTITIAGGTVDSVSTDVHVVVTGGSVGSLGSSFISPAINPELRGGTIQSALVSGSLNLVGVTSHINQLTFAGSLLNLNTTNVNSIDFSNNSNPPPTTNIFGGTLNAAGSQFEPNSMTVNMYAGHVAGAIWANTINLYGGQTGDLGTFNGPLNVFGGQFGSLTSKEGPINMYAGATPGVSGGQFSLYGGSVDLLNDEGFPVYLYGGTVKTLLPTPGDPAYIYGGSIDLVYSLGTIGTLNFYGSGLTFDGSTVQGTLADGSPIDLAIPQGDVVNLFETPEPGSFGLLFSLGMVGCCLWRRRRRKWDA